MAKVTVAAAAELPPADTVSPAPALDGADVVESTGADRLPPSASAVVDVPVLVSLLNSC